MKIIKKIAKESTVITILDPAGFFPRTAVVVQLPESREFEKSTPAKFESKIAKMDFRTSTLNDRNVYGQSSDKWRVACFYRFPARVRLITVHAHTHARARAGGIIRTYF